MSALLTGLLLPQVGLGEEPSAPRLSVIPRPMKVEVGEGAFALSQGTRIVVDAEASGGEAVAEYLASALRAATGLPFPVATGSLGDAGQGTLLLTGSAFPPELGEEGYVLDVRPTGVVVRAGSGAGFFYGVQTLLQLLPPSGGGTPIELATASLPCLRLVDRPRFAWRGLMLDASRHFQSVATVKRFLDLMALHKLNTFHWHLVDGQGWRIEIPSYPKLTDVGAWRNQPGFPEPGRTERYGGFYTQDDIREVVAYAAARHITIVPEIEMPGHSWAAIAAYPQLGCLQQPQEVSYFFDYPCREQRFPDPPGTDVLCAGREEVFGFLEAVLSDVMDLFPSTYIHVGGDEVDKKWWRDCPACQARMKAENLADENDLQSHFIKRIEAYLNRHGRRLIGWDEILEGGLAPHATVMSWRGTQGGIVAARSGHDVVMSPQNPLYFDHGQSADPAHPAHWPGIETLEEVYAYDPIPSELTPEEARHVLGAQANLWTAFIHTPELLELMTYPRACALSEITWSPAAGADWDDFHARLQVHLPRLQALGVNYFRLRSVAIGSWEPARISPRSTELTYDVTDRIVRPGVYLVTLKYTRGDHGLDLHQVALLEDGAPIAVDAHLGFTGWKNDAITYQLAVPAPNTGASYRIQVRASGSGGTDSFGQVFLQIP